MSVMVQIFHKVKNVIDLFNEAKTSWMKHFIFHRTKYLFHYHDWENIHYLFYNLYIDWNFQPIKKIKVMKNHFSSSKTLYNPRVQH